MADPKTYPSLEQLLGEDAAETPGEPDSEPDETNAGAKLWILFLNRKN